MLTDIINQPHCLHDCFHGRLMPWNNVIKLSCMTEHRTRLLRAKRFVIVACGSSWHAGLIGKQLIEKYCNIPVDVEYASEFRYSNPVITPEDIVIAISQSGETADTIASAELAKSRGAFIFGIINEPGSILSNITDTGIYLHVGKEHAQASTKTFTGEVLCLTMFALTLARDLGTINMDEYTRLVRELEVIPQKITDILNSADNIKLLAKEFTYTKNFLYLGRGWNFPVALEGALKLKEISHIHAEDYPAAEMKHGPIALIDQKMPCMFIATHLVTANGREYTDDMGSGKIISNMQEVKARNGEVIAIVTEGDTDIASISDESLAIPKTYPTLAPLLSVIPLQLFAYYIAEEKGLLSCSSTSD